MKYNFVFLVLAFHLAMLTTEAGTLTHKLQDRNVRHLVKRLAIPGCQAGRVKLGYTTTERGKSTSKSILFSPPFAETPALVYGLSRLDSIKSQNVRIVADVKSLDENGFILTLKSWKPTLTYDAWLQWMACPK